MRLLYVIEHISTTGGLERILIDKMNALACESCFDITLLTVWSDTLPPAYPLHQDIQHLCLNIPAPQGTWQMLMTMPRVIRAFNRSVHHIAPDCVIHFRAIGAMLMAFSSWHGRSIFEAHLARQHSNHRWLYPLMERKADAIVCLTKADAANYPHARHVQVIPNFTTISTHTLHDYSQRTCLFLGRLCREKDPLRLLRLWQRLVQQHPGWLLDIYGIGPMEAEVREEIQHLGLSDSVRMLGHTTSPHHAYSTSSILLLTSRTEGLPMVLIEAMRCHLPVVSVDCPYGPSDIILDGHNGYLVPLDDDEAFVVAVSRLMQSQELRQTLGTQAHHTSYRYTKSEIIQRWKQFFLNP